MKDCIIVGGGPGGLTAALYLVRFLRTVIVYDAQDGRASMIPKTHNQAAFPNGISGSDLLEQMRSSAMKYGAIIEKTTVRNIRMDNNFEVTSDQGIERAQNVILATGVYNHRPPLSTKDHDLGLARGLIRYCPVCDANEVRDLQVAVLGSGEHGIAEAKFIRDYTPSVTLIPPAGRLEVARDGIGAFSSPMFGLSLSQSALIVTLEDGTAHGFDTMYVALGTAARNSLVIDLKVKLAEDGCVVTDQKQKTNISGLYAIGDVTDGLDQIAVAMGQGVIAATEIHNNLRESGF